MDVQPVANTSARPLARRSVLLMIVFVFATLGVYTPVWFLRRRAALNGLDSPRKLSALPFWILLVFLAAVAVLQFAKGNAPMEQLLGAPLALVLSLARLGMLILVVVQCFFVKDILEDHLASPETSEPFVARVTVSGLMTFFFGIFYLQYVINKHIVRAASPSPALAAPAVPS